MKLIFLFLLISICSFGQKTITTASSAGITVTDEVRLNQLGLDRHVDFSKGEALQEKDWQNFKKAFESDDQARHKYYRQRDSTHVIFINYSVSSYIMPGDTVESYEVTEKGINWKLKPKKK